MSLTKKLTLTALALAALLLLLLLGPLREWSRDLIHRWTSPNLAATRPPASQDPALVADLPRRTQGSFPSPLDALLAPNRELTLEQQTDIIGTMLLDYWVTTRTLPNGTWEEVCAQLAGANMAKLALVPADHPALGKQGFAPKPNLANSPHIRLHVIGASEAHFQLIYDGPDGKPYTDDDLIRNFPQ
jgi:hypothetical protein